MINQNQLNLLCFGKRWDTEGEGIIIGDNPAGHCFLLRYLIPMNFFKYSWLWDWKCASQVEFLIKFVFKNWEITFFPNMGSVIRKRMGWDIKENLDVCSWYRLSNAFTEIYIFLKFEFYLKPILKNWGIYVYLLKLVTLAYTLDCNVSWTYTHKDQQQA